MVTVGVGQTMDVFMEGTVQDNFSSRSFIMEVSLT